MIQKIIIGVVAAVIVLAGSSPAFAQGMDDVRAEEPHREGAARQLESTVEKVVEDTSNVVTKVNDDILQSEKQRIEARKAELRERLAQKMAERKAKLEGRRLAQCENRQKRINELLDKSIATGRIHLENIQRVEQRVAEFYAKKELVSADYDTALANANAAEVNAVAALEVSDDEVFDCQAVDATNPARVVHDVRESKKAALDAYRQSVIELIHVTKRVFSTQAQEDGDNV